MEGPRLTGAAEAARYEPANAAEPGDDGVPEAAAPEGGALDGRRGGPAHAIAQLLHDEPMSFEFFQAVRLLERLAPDRAPVGYFGDPGNEVVRFRANTNFSFPPSEIAALDDDVDEGAPPEMTVNFMGLMGPQGALPLHYSAMVRDRERQKDTALRDFLDLFNHRAISLFYRAWEKHRFTVSHERDRRDRLTLHLLDLVGLGTRGLQDRLPVPDETLLYYTGLLAVPSRPASALESLLADYFDVPVQVEQFVGGWYPLDEATCCRLGEGTRATAPLGGGAVVGDETWDQQSRIRVRLGPLTRPQFESFLPTGDAHDALRALVRFFTGDSVDAQARLVLARDAVPRFTLGDDDIPPLGWGTWLSTRPASRDPDETVLTL
jgi:type VI secretion system protein ImpH